MGWFDSTKKSLPMHNVIKIRPKSKNQDQEQVIEKIACSFLREIEKSLDKQFQMCGEAP